MINLITGTPGSGKSYDTIVRRFLPAFRAGREIWTNLEGLNLEYCSILFDVPPEYKDNVVFLVDDVAFEMMPPEERAKAEEKDKDFEGNAFFYWFKNFMGGEEKRKPRAETPPDLQGIQITPDGRKVCAIWDFYKYIPSMAVAIIDEVQNYWSAKDYANVPQSFDKYLTLHRHYGNDIYFLSQRPKNVYKQIQSLSEYVWKFEKMGWLGLPGRYKGAVSLGDDPRRVVSRVVRKYEKRYFKCYKSYVAGDLKELKVESSTIFKPWQIASVVVFVLMMGYKFVSMPWFSGKARVPEAQAKGVIIDKIHIEKDGLADFKKDYVQVKKKKKKRYVLDGLGISGSKVVIFVNSKKYNLLGLSEKLKKPVSLRNGNLVVDGRTYEVGERIRF